MKKTEIKVGSRKKEEKKKTVGTVKTRGKTFEGKVIKKFPKRVVIEFERSIYVRKYERYAKSKTKLHARLPENFENEINIGDYIKIRECRPLSKIIHFVVVEKIKSGESPFFLLAERKSSDKESKLIVGERENKLLEKNNE